METWKSIVGYEGLYEVSDLGRVRSLSWNQTGQVRVLSPVKTHDGYLQVGLRKAGHVRKFFKVHRLVAQTFIPNPNNLETVNHKDENKLNNSASNLEWLSRLDNIAYSRPQLSERKVQMFDKQGNLLATFPSIHEAERVTGIANWHICRCCKGKLKLAGGFIWKYAEAPLQTSELLLDSE